MFVGTKSHLIMQITYSSIKPIIVSEVIEGNNIQLKFQARNQEQPIDAIATIMPSQDEMMKNVTRQTAKTAAANIGIRSIFSIIGNLLGGIFGSAANAAGSAVSSTVNQNSMNADKLMSTQITSEKKEEAIVNCFKNYLSMYTWENNQWQYQQPASN